MNIIKPLMAIEEQNEGGQSSFPSSPAPRQGQANISPVPLALSPGTGPGPAEPLHCRSWGQHSGAECGAVTSRHRFGVIRLVLIQLQKFGKHFVNNPRPGRVMLSQSGSSEPVTFPALTPFSLMRESPDALQQSQTHPGLLRRGRKGRPKHWEVFE